MFAGDTLSVELISRVKVCHEKRYGNGDVMKPYVHLNVSVYFSTS